MKLVKNAMLIGGLQNLLQIGLVYPLNLLAVIYYIVKGRFNVKTTLDLLIVIYVAAGVFSFVSGALVSLTEGSDVELWINSTKSFFVFITILVFFGAYIHSVDDLFKTSMVIFSLTAISILINYIWLLVEGSLSLYQTRSAISWCSGWPQRWVVFAIIGHFFFLCRYDYSKKFFDLTVSIVFVTITLLSATRSAIVGIFFAYIVLSFFSKKDFFRALGFLIIILAVAIAFIDPILDALRLSEIVEYTATDDPGATSMNNRTLNLWPGIFNSLEMVRLPFGWGHAGVAFIPHNFFPDQSQISNIPGEQAGSAESQYMDILLRQGLVGFVLFISILICGLIYTYKVYRLENNVERKFLWKAAFAWQFAIGFHGVTVETIRYPLYSLFFFLYLGILSANYQRLTNCHHNSRYFYKLAP